MYFYTSVLTLQFKSVHNGSQWVRSFDSRHNVLTPKRVKTLSNRVVEWVRCGGGHCIVYTSLKRGSPGGSGSDGIRGSRSPVSMSSESKSRGEDYGSASGLASKARSPLSFYSDGNSSDSSYYDLDDALGLTGPIKAEGKIVEKREVDSNVDKKGSFGVGVRVSSEDEQNIIDANLSSIKKERLEQSEGEIDDSIAEVSASASVALGSGDPNLLSPHVISWTRHKKIAELSYALAHGADVNRCDDNGNTPLIVACQNGHATVCHLLVEHGADLRMSNKKGNTALHYCFAYNFDDLGKFLISQGADEFATNNEGLTCYEGLSMTDLDQI